MNPYLLLEVPYRASNSDIKKAYRRLALKWHPDKNGGSLDSEERFKNIQLAYDCLGDPIKRAALDLKRKHMEQAKVAQKVRAESELQARATTFTKPTVSSSGSPNWGAVGLAILALAGIGAALSQSQDPRRRTRPNQRRHRRTR